MKSLKEYYTIQEIADMAKCHIDRTKKLIFVEQHEKELKNQIIKLCKCGVEEVKHFSRVLELEKELTKFREYNTHLDKQLKSVKEKNQKLKKKIEEYEETNNSMGFELEQKYKQIKKLKKELESTRDSKNKVIVRLEKELEDLKINRICPLHKEKSVFCKKCAIEMKEIFIRDYEVDYKAKVIKWIDEVCDCSSYNNKKVGEQCKDKDCIGCDYNRRLKQKLKNV